MNQLLFPFRGILFLEEEKQTLFCIWNTVLTMLYLKFQPNKTKQNRQTYKKTVEKKSQGMGENNQSNY